MPFQPSNKHGQGRTGPNKVTADIKALAQTHGEAAIKELHRIATTAENDATRVAAIRELLDRGFGKATQYVEAQFGLSHEDALDQLK